MKLVAIATGFLLVVAVTARPAREKRELPPDLDDLLNEVDGKKKFFFNLQLVVRKLPLKRKVSHVVNWTYVNGLFY